MEFPSVRIEILTKREGRTGRISVRGLDRGPYKKDRGPIFSLYDPEQAWLIRDLLYNTSAESFGPILARSNTYRILDRQ